MAKFVKESTDDLVYMAESDIITGPLKSAAVKNSGNRM
jgi:hypothetical protein